MTRPERSETLPWWTGVPPAHATVACGGGEHRLVWKDGVLTAADHGDPQSERALMALGGERLACIDMLDAFERHVGDPEVLLLGSRGAADPLVAGEELPRGVMRTARGGPGMARAGVGMARAGTARAGRGTARAGAATGQAGAATARLGFTPAGAGGATAEEDQLARLLLLGGGLGRRLDATVAAHWRERLRTPDAETNLLHARLNAALYGRVFATIGTWLGQGEVRLTLEILPEGSPPSLARTADGGLSAALPFGWLVDVWARGLDVIWGRFCLAATTADGRRWELQTVTPELGEPGTVEITLPG